MNRRAAARGSPSQQGAHYIAARRPRWRLRRVLYAGAVNDFGSDATTHAPKDPLHTEAEKVVESAAPPRESQAWAPRELMADGRRVILTRRDEDSAAATE